MNLVDKELLDKMKAAGCVLIGYGVESGSPAILKEMNKRATVEQAKKAIDLTWKSGIMPFPYMMFGMPSETEDTIRETVEFCKEIGIVEGFGFATPIPCTPLYYHARDAGKIGSLIELVEGWKEWQKKPLVNMTALPTERLVALKEMAERTIVNHVVSHHKKLLLRKLFYYYRIHGMMPLMSKLARWGAKFVGRNFRRGNKVAASLQDGGS